MNAKNKNGEKFNFSLTAGQIVTLGCCALLFLSGNPMAQKAASSWLGVESPVSNIEKVRGDAEKMNEKLDRITQKMAVMVEDVGRLRIDVDSLKRVQSRTAGN